MWTVTGLALMALGVSAYLYSLRIGRFRRVPWEQVLLLSAAALVGLAALLRQPSWWSGAAFAVEALALVAYIWYLTLGGRFPRDQLSLRPGDRFPRFTLPDSKGEPFSSESLIGKSSALYLFYRGDW